MNCTVVAGDGGTMSHVTSVGFFVGSNSGSLQYGYLSVNLGADFEGDEKPKG